FVVGFERGLKGLHSFQRLVFLEKQLAPRGVDRGIAWSSRRRVAVRRIRLLELSEGAQRPGGAREISGVTRAIARRDALEKGGGVRAPQHLLQQPEHQRRFARRGP